MNSLLFSSVNDFITIFFKDSFFSDVKIKSYAFSLNVTNDHFYNILNQSGFTKSKNQKLCLYFDDEEFSNLNYQNINELYDFKKTLQDNKIIIPILKESKLSKKSVTFTPINPSDLIALDGLLPPKSTWITPRL